MIQQSIDSSSVKDCNRFALCIIIGKRARGLMNGTPELTESTSKNKVSIAIKEICENKISFQANYLQVRKQT